MPAKWQKWMPIYIDRLLGSSDVQMMEPASFKGYMCLLMSAWQTDDCTVSADPGELARDSRLGVRLWARHSQEVLRKFVTVTVTVGGALAKRYRNVVEYEIWCEAKRVFEARRHAADRTNSVRQPRRSPSAETNGHRHTVTGTVTGTEKQGEAPPDRMTVPDPDFADDPAENIPDGLEAAAYANGLLEVMGISKRSSYPVFAALMDVLRMLARDERCSLGEAARRLLSRMREAERVGPVKWRFWLGEEGGWKQREIELSTEGLE